jgi:hypothetical protein
VALVISSYYAEIINKIAIAAGILLNLSALAPTLYFASAQQQLKRPWLRLLPIILFENIFMAGMMLNTTRAALQAVLRSRRVFKRTPKYGLREKGERWLGRKYQLSLDPIVFFELLLMLFNTFTILIAIKLENWLIAGYASIFSLGLLFTSVSTLAQSLAQLRSRVK